MTNINTVPKGRISTGMMPLRNLRRTGGKDYSGSDRTRLKTLLLRSSDVEDDVNGVKKGRHGKTG